MSRQHSATMREAGLVGRFGRRDALERLVAVYRMPELRQRARDWREAACRTVCQTRRSQSVPSFLSATLDLRPVDADGQAGTKLRNAQKGNKESSC